MGGFFGSIQVRTGERDPVLKAVATLVRDDLRFLVGPELDGWVAVYPSGNGQDIAVAAALATRVSMPVIHLLVHDDDVFAYEAYAEGKPIDSYNSRPDYFEPVDDAERERVRGRPECLTPLVGAVTASVIAELLEAARREAHEPAHLFLERFAALFGIRNAVTSFEYLERGERDGIVGWRKFAQVPDERAARRAAAKAVGNEWAELERRGVITLRDDRLLVKAVFAAADGSLWTLRGGPPFVNGKVPGRVERWAPPWKTPEPVLEAGLDQAHNLSVDGSRRWLSIGHASGDWHARLWDCAARALAAEVEETEVIRWTGFTADGQYLVTLGARLIVTDVATGARLGESSPDLCGQTAAIDDARGLVAVATRRGLATFELPHARPVRVPDPALPLDRGEHVFAICFDVPRDHLIVGTRGGLRVYPWSQAIATGLTPIKPVHAAAMRVTYAVALDATRSRVLYGGIDGTLATLDLGTGRTCTRLTLPGTTSIFQLARSPTGSALAAWVGSRPGPSEKRWSGVVAIDLDVLE